MEELEKKIVENYELKQELAHLKTHQQNLEAVLNQITSAKAFKLWQTFNKIKKLIKQAILNPKKIFKAVKILFTQGSKGVIEKLKSQETQQQQALTINQQYQIWLKKNYPSTSKLAKQRVNQRKFKYRPKISIITPVYNTPEKFLRECIGSVINQTYDNWELCLVDDASTNLQVKKIIKEYAKRETRIKYKLRKTNGHICHASNDALKLATGEFVGLLDHDDILWPNALFEVAKLLNKKPHAQFIYSDEDKISKDGIYHFDPFLKPNWSPDLLFSFMYTGHFTVYRKFLVEKIGAFRDEFRFSQDYDLALRMSEVTNNIFHIENILYSWRAAPGSAARGDKNYARKTNILALESTVKRRNYNAEVIEYPYANRVKFKIAKLPLISIIIPSDDIKNITFYVLKIIENTDYRDLEIIIVTNSKIINKLHNFKQKIRYVVFDKTFNFSEKCNKGAKVARGEYLLFLNDDVYPVNNSWLYNMAEILERKEVGAVGAKLLYETNKIQHAGLVTGVREYIGTAFHQHEANSYFYFNFIQLTRNVSALSGACLLIRKKIFDLVGGFDEKYLPIYHSDGDLSFKIRNMGYCLTYTPFAVLKHGGHTSLAKEKTLTKDNSDLVMINRWPEFMKKDKFYTKSMIYFLHSNGSYPFELILNNVPPDRVVTNTNPNLLLVSHDLEFTGAPIQLYHLAKYLLQHNYNVYIISPKIGPLLTLYKKLNIPVFIDALILDSIQNEHLRLFNNFDVIITNTILCWKVVKAVKEMKIKTIWFIHESDFGKDLTTKHSDVQYCLKNTDLAIFSTKRNREVYKRYLNKNNGKIINYGIEIYNSNKLKFKYNKKEDERYFLTLASFEPRKGQDLLIKAILKLPLHITRNSKFFVIGKVLNYNYYIDIKNLASKYPNIIFIEGIDYKSVNEYFRLIDVYICPSRDESLPLTVLEAMAHSKLIISTKVGGIPEIIKHKINGLLIKPNDVNSLAHNIIDTFNNFDNYSYMGHNACKSFQENYTIEKYGQKVNKCIKELIN